MITFIIPTRNRPAELCMTLDRLSALDPSMLGHAPELIIVDNDSDEAVDPPRSLPNGMQVRAIHLNRNIGAAARNVAAEEAEGDWLVMLDDDSSPVEGDLARMLRRAPDDVAAIGFETLLPDGSHEAGGLPEVIIGCACAIRRRDFLAAGAYDPAFDYYVEEYDLCARLIAEGKRITFSRDVIFEHRKVASGRSFDRILSRLVRNNAWVIQRYAPKSELGCTMDRMIARYERIAKKECAESGFALGMAQLESTLKEQERSSLTQEQWDRFIGRTVVREHLPNAMEGMGTARLLARGKGDDIIEGALRDGGIELTDDPGAPAVIATLSPGPLIDAIEAHPDAMAPWSVPPPSQAPLRAINSHAL